MNNTNIRIIRYKSDYDDQLFFLLENEGLEWKDYWKGSGKSKYQKALASSITYLLYEKNILCGYIRCRNDDGFGVYVYDLLVDKEYRGNEYGRMLIEQVANDYPKSNVYVMSDVDSYYKKLGYEIEGTIFKTR